MQSCTHPCWWELEQKHHLVLSSPSYIFCLYRIPIEILQNAEWKDWVYTIKYISHNSIGEKYFSIKIDTGVSSNSTTVSEKQCHKSTRFFTLWTLIQAGSQACRNSNAHSACLQVCYASQEQENWPMPSKLALHYTEWKPALWMPSIGRTVGNQELQSSSITFAGTLKENFFCRFNASTPQIFEQINL